MVKPLKDLEQGKFNQQGNLKVSVEEDNTSDTARPVRITNDSSQSVPVTITNPDSGSDVDVTVKNTSSTPVPVEIVNTDTQVDLEVNIAESITIDSSTPVDVNLTNSSVNTNATIVGTPNVNVSNSELTTRNQLLYTDADITALGSSTSVTEWTSAKADGILTYSHVGQWNNEFAEITYYTHPDLGDGNKCLKETIIYTTQNGATVENDFHYSVVDWTFDSSIQGSVAISTTTPVSPSPDADTSNSTICSISVTDNTFGDVTISLSGTNASLYAISNGTTTASSFTYDSALSYSLILVSDVSGADYSHSITLTATGVEFGVTDSVSIETSGTYGGVATYSNSYKLEGQAFYTASGVYAETSNGGFFSTGTTFDDINSTTRRTYNFWLYKPSNFNGEIVYFGDYLGTNGLGGSYVLASRYGTADLTFISERYGYYRYAGINLPSGYEDTWIMVTVILDPNPPSTKFYLQNSTTFNNTAYQATVYTGNWNYNTYADNITISSVYGARTYNNALYPTSSSGMSTNTYGVDEFTAWNKELSLTEIEELHNSFEVYDYTTHSASSNLFRYVRFGDGTNDSESSIQCQIDSSFVLDKNGSASGTYINSLTASEAPYVPASGAWSNAYYVNDVYQATTVGTSTDPYDFGNYAKDCTSDNEGFFPSLESSGNFRSSGNVSYSFYFKGDTSGGGNRILFCERYLGNSTRQDGLWVYISEYSTYYHYLNIEARDGSHRTNKNYLQIRFSVTSGSSLLVDDTWKHIVITTNADDVVSGSTVYMDDVDLKNNTPTGVLYTNVSNYTLDRTSAVRSVHFGGVNTYHLDTAANTYSTSPYGGNATGNFIMDEFTTWSKTLSSSEITELYNSGTIINPSTHSASANLERYFRFGDNASDGANIYDENDSNFYLQSYDSTDNTTAY